MNGKRAFVDTNIILYLLSGNEEIKSLLLDRQILISYITELELLSFPFKTSKEEKIVRELLNHLTIIENNQKIKDLTVDIRKSTKLKLPDSIILATSEFMNLTLFTADKAFMKAKNYNTLIYEID